MNINIFHKRNGNKIPERIVLGLIFILISFSGNSQPAQFRFNHFTSEDGLAQNTVYSVTQDKYGFMWFSTKNGITKYDGFSVKNFKPSNITTGDVVDVSQCIVTDNEGNVVFGTGHGLYIIDVNSDSVLRNVNFNNIDSSDIYVNNIFAILPDSNFYWLGTGNGLIRYNKITNTKKYFSGSDLIPGWETKRCWIKSLAKGPDGKLYISTQKGLIRMNPATLTFSSFSSKGLGEYYVDNDYFSALQFDKQGRLWAGTLRKGVYCFELSKGTHSNINFTGLTDSSETFNEVKRLTLDKFDQLWIGTQYTGLVRLDTKSLSMQRIRSNSISSYSLSSDLISALYEDRNGVLWIGTYNNGVDRTNVAGTPFVNIPFASPDSSCFQLKAVECFAEQDSIYIWVGTMQGLFRFNRLDYTCASFEEVTGGKIPLPHPSIVGLEIDSSNNLWIGCRSDVITKVNIHNLTYQYYAPDTTNPLIKGSLDCRAIAKSPAGEIILCFDTRILKYDLQSDKINLVLDKDSALLKISRMHLMSFDNQNNIFICSDYYGFFKLNLSSLKMDRIGSPDETKDKLSTNTLLRQFKNGEFVITDFKGLYLLDQQLNFKNLYSEKQGLSDSKIINTHIDGLGRVWVATFNGLSVFNPNNNTFRNYYVQDGLAENEFRESKSLMTRDGYMFFPTNKGFTFLNPENVNVTARQTPVFFTSFKVAGKEQKFKTNINDIHTISIPAGNNFFNISFASEGFNTINRAAFMYKLEGVDKEWIVALPGQNSANYTNIEGGDYIFRVKEQGENSSERILKINMGTLFYKEWWFKLLLAGALFLVLFYFVRFRERQMREAESSKTIDYFANSFYGKNSVDEILWDVCRNCISRLGFEDAVVYILDENRKVLIQKAAYGPKNPKDFEIVHPLEIPLGYGVVGTVARTGKAELISDTTKDGRYIADDEKRMSELSVPIIYKDKVIGVIDSEHSRKRFFTGEHLRLLSTIASICSTKIAKAMSDQEASDRERMLLEIGKKVAETRLMALRAQMNPHFIFNSLNSIQECIVHRKIDDAQRYLVQFSRLLRMVIDNSEQNTIGLDNEIEFLKLYLDLESLRFGNSFEYHIDVDTELDAEEIRLPSLIVQPFVENAIWHGLLHKDGKRMLNISFKLKDSDQIIITVEDNGIGRKKASEIRADRLNVMNHESKGLRITGERIELVKLQTQFKPEIVVEDLFSTSGNAIGTRVTVILPLDIDKMEETIS